MTTPKAQADRKVILINTKIRWLYFGVGFIILFVALAGFATLGYLRQEINTHVTKNTQNLARSVEQTINGMIDTIDVALLATADELLRQQRTGKIDKTVIDDFLKKQRLRVPHVAFMRAADEYGVVTYGVDPKASPISILDRAYFTELRDQPNHGLYIEKPLLGKIAKKWIWIFAERVNKPDGSFGGVVYATVEIDELENTLRQIDMEAGGVISIRDRNMNLIARTTFDRINPIPTGNSKLTVSFQKALAENAREGSYISDTTSIDKITRLVSYRRSEKYGYMVNVGLSLDTVLHAWRNQTVSVSIFITLFSIVLLFMTQKIHSAWSRDGKMILTLEANTREIEEKHQALIDTEKQHLGLLKKLYTAIVVHAPDTRIIFSNSRASELLGLSAEQLHGKEQIDAAWDFVDENGKVLSIEDYPVSRVLRSGKEIREQVLGIQNTSNANRRWVQVSAFPENNEQGELKQVVVNFHDITERKEAEMRWQFALEGAGDGVWDIDLLQNIASYSKRYLDMLGYQDDEFPHAQNAWLDQVHPEDRGNLIHILQNYLDGKTPQYAAEYRMLCKDGRYIWIYARGMIVHRDTNGKPLRMVGTHADISTMKVAEEKIWREANYDALTQLPNRRLFYDRIEESLRTASRRHERIAVLFIDLDRFKEVNDTLGHHIGDQLLVEAARRIQGSVRALDTVARLGGDEFTVILGDIYDRHDVGHLAEKMIEKLSQPYFLAGSESYVSASIGISFYPDDADNVVDLTKNADQAMYFAKTCGRQCYRYFTKIMQEEASHRIRLANDLRHSMRLGQLEVYYQAIVNLQTGKTTKAEALLRWDHPELGLIPTKEFIPIAEDTGLIHNIGDWVFTQAIQQVQACEAQLNAPFQISVNKSPVQFFVEREGKPRWVDQLQESGIDGSRIVVEITEGVLVADDARVSKCLLHYRDAGIQVAIDDFGTGYSSLSYLKEFDVDYLKIDQSFIQNLSRNSTELALCEAIVVMAHKLDMFVIAEGVETPEQEALLREIGCDFGQGFLFSQPLKAKEFIQFLNT